MQLLEEYQHSTGPSFQLQGCEQEAGAGEATGIELTAATSGGTAEPEAVVSSPMVKKAGRCDSMLKV
jgi:hypothetical protein